VVKFMKDFYFRLKKITVIMVVARITISMGY